MNVVTPPGDIFVVDVLLNVNIMSLLYEFTIVIWSPIEADVGRVYADPPVKLIVPNISSEDSVLLAL
jgi:hypothetical protein